MNTFTMNCMEDSFICANQPMQNYSKFAYLKVGSGDCERGVTKTLIKFDANKVKMPHNIEKVVLELYVNSISASNDELLISIHTNQKNFLQEYVSWDNTPKVEDEVLRFNVSIYDENKYISIDITNVMIDWLKGEKNNFGVTLINNTSLGEVTFASSRGYNSPKLQVHYY